MSGQRTALNYYSDEAGPQIVDPNNGKPYRDQSSKDVKGGKASSSRFFSFRTFGKTKPSPVETSDDRILSYDVAIRPSFYWLDVDISPEERLAQEQLAKSLKSDCQDEAVVIEDFAGMKGSYFVGVFDGHGPDGRAAAKYAAQSLPKYLAKDPRIWSDDTRKRYKAFKTACYHTNEDLHRPLVCHLNATLSGTTACFAIVQGRTVCVGSTGDSRCIVVRRKSNGDIECEQLSWDAKPEVLEERKRIRLKGGIVAQLQDPSGNSVGAYRVFRKPGDLLPGLAMSRSLGDSLAHSLGVIAKPAFKVYDIREDDVCMVFGSDGVFDVMDNQRVGEFVLSYMDSREPGVTTADILTIEAQEQWKLMGDDIIVDDTSAVVVHLHNLPPPTRTNPDKVFVKAAHSNDVANDMYQIYERNPSIDPRMTPHTSFAEENGFGSERFTKTDGNDHQRPNVQESSNATLSDDSHPVRKAAQVEGTHVPATHVPSTGASYSTAANSESPPLPPRSPLPPNHTSKAAPPPSAPQDVDPPTDSPTAGLSAVSSCESHPTTPSVNFDDAAATKRFAVVRPTPFAMAAGSQRAVFATTDSTTSTGAAMSSPVTKSRSTSSLPTVQMLPGEDLISYAERSVRDGAHGLPVRASLQLPPASSSSVKQMAMQRSVSDDHVSSQSLKATMARLGALGTPTNDAAPAGGAAGGGPEPVAAKAYGEGKLAPISVVQKVVALADSGSLPSSQQEGGSSSLLTDSTLGLSTTLSSLPSPMIVGTSGGLSEDSSTRSADDSRRGHKLHAGQEGRVRGGMPRVTSLPCLAAEPPVRASFATTWSDDTDLSSGLGDYRRRSLPEGGKVTSLAEQAAKVGSELGVASDDTASALSNMAGGGKYAGAMIAGEDTVDIPSLQLSLVSPGVSPGDRQHAGPLAQTVGS